MHVPAILVAMLLSTNASGPPKTESACAGLSAAERNLTFIVPAKDVEGVVPLREQRFHVSRSNALPVLTGAIIYVRPESGLTVDRLQRISSCHVAEVAGHADGCPLLVPGAVTSVRFDGNRFVVEVRSDNPERAGDILRRAQDLTSSSSS